MEIPDILNDRVITNVCPETFPRGGVAVVAPFPLGSPSPSVSPSVALRADLARTHTHAFHTTDEHLAGSRLIIWHGGLDKRDNNESRGRFEPIPPMPPIYNRGSDVTSSTCSHSWSSDVYASLLTFLLLFYIFLSLPLLFALEPKILGRTFAIFQKIIRTTSNLQFKITYMCISYLSFSSIFSFNFYPDLSIVFFFLSSVIFLFSTLDRLSFSLSLSLSPLYASLSPAVHASTHPRIPNESTLCLPSFIGTLIIALVIAWFRLHYFEERLLSRMLPNCLRSLPFMMHGFNNSVSIDRLRFIADHRHVVVHVVGRGGRGSSKPIWSIDPRWTARFLPRKNKIK